MEEERKQIRRLQEVEKRLMGLMNELCQQDISKSKRDLAVMSLTDIDDSRENFSKSAEKIRTMLERLNSKARWRGCTGGKKAQNGKQIERTSLSKSKMQPREENACQAYGRISLKLEWMTAKFGL